MGKKLIISCEIKFFYTCIVSCESHVKYYLIAVIVFQIRQIYFIFRNQCLVRPEAMLRSWVASE